VAAAALLALAGCGGSNDNGTTTAADAPSSTTTSAPAASSTTTTGSATKPKQKSATSPSQSAPAANKKQKKASPTSLKLTARQQKQLQRLQKAELRADAELARLCPPKAPSNLPKPPKSAAQMPRYARTVLPAAKRNARRIGAARAPQNRLRLGGLSSSYRTLVPFLEQIAKPGTSQSEVKALSKPATRMVQSVHLTAVAANVASCGLPV
jgi:hypothetical protein